MKINTYLHVKCSDIGCRGIILLLFSLFFSGPVFAQNFSVSGVVKSQLDGEALPGVNIVIKGTATGTITDVNGNYTITVGSENDILVFSFVGYTAEEVKVGNQSSIKISLKPDVKSLEEVVVIGYGTSNRRDLTGSISSIKSEDIKLANPVTFEQAMQGKIPGLIVQQVSGQPGGAVSMQVRGRSTFADGQGQPLYVIDGVIMGGVATLGPGTNPLAAINPSEIESIDVLKDASATAIYGSQATNGVVVITTKRGQEGAPQISYEGYYGFQQLPKKLPTMNLREFATFINDRSTGIGWEFDTREEFTNPEYLGEGTDWQEELFRNAPMSNHTININGGDARTQYLFSGSYFTQEGIAFGSDFNRISLRLNLDNKTTDWLKIGTSLQLANIKENVTTSGSTVIETALEQTPDIPVKNADGSWGGRYNEDGWITNTANPYAIALINKDEAKRNQVLGNIYAEIIFTKDLTLRNEVTGSFSMATRDKFEPSYVMGTVEKENNFSSYEFSQNFYSILRNYLTYAHLFNEILNVNVMAGHEAQLGQSESLTGSRTDFPSNNVQVINSGDATTAKNSGSKGHNAQESYFGRLNLGLYDKYLFTANVRNDGSSNFADGSRWVVTYSGALAWKINNESFLKNSNIVNELKLRVGYGLTNNQNIDGSAYVSRLESVTTGLSGVSQRTLNIGNPYVEWETTKNANIGLDGSIFNWRINFSVDFYNRDTDGLLMQTSLPWYSGTAVGWSPGSLAAPYVNIGSVNNKGFDFRISSSNISTKNFTWKTDVTVSRNINKVIKLNAKDASITKAYAKTVAGRSMGEFYGYIVDGVFATETDFLGDKEKGIKPHARPVNSEGEMYPIGPDAGSIWYGDMMFKDLNNDGIIDERDQTFLGSPIPKYQIGLNNSFSYKNFDLNIFFNANYGNKVFNQLRIDGEYPGTSLGYLTALNDYAKLALKDQEGASDDISNVYVANPDTRIVGLRNDDTNGNRRVSDKYVEDGSFIRCKTISLGYTLPTNLLAKAHISSLRVYANVSNAFIITKYKGMDPEIGSWNPVEAGIDNGFYPQPRVFTLGVNMMLTK